MEQLTACTRTRTPTLCLPVLRYFQCRSIHPYRPPEGLVTTWVQGKVVTGAEKQRCQKRLQEQVSFVAILSCAGAGGATGRSFTSSALL